MLNSEEVKKVFGCCLYQDDEIINGKPIIEPILVEGVIGKFGLHPDRVKENKSTIIEMLNELPDDFKMTGGGGMSFLNMCNDKNGRQWTDLHRTMELLVCLGIVIGKVEYNLPKEDWSMLPGSMQYIVIGL